jgi:hypothetical protein
LAALSLSINALLTHCQGLKLALADPKIKARSTDLGGTPVGGSPAEFSKGIADQTEKWAKVIRTPNIKVGVTSSDEGSAVARFAPYAVASLLQATPA